MRCRHREYAARSAPFGCSGIGAPSFPFEPDAPTKGPN